MARTYTIELKDGTRDVVEKIDRHTTDSGNFHLVTTVNGRAVVVKRYNMEDIEVFSYKEPRNRSN